jgi:hypothetical protein
VEVNHDFKRGEKFSAVTCAKEIKPPMRIIALCCCSECIDQAKDTGCAKALLNRQYYLLPQAISHILAT